MHSDDTLEPHVLPIARVYAEQPRPNYEMPLILHNQDAVKTASNTSQKSVQIAARSTIQASWPTSNDPFIQAAARATSRLLLLPSKLSWPSYQGPQPLSRVDVYLSFGRVCNSSLQSLPLFALHCSSPAVGPSHHISFCYAPIFLPISTFRLIMADSGSTAKGDIVQNISSSPTASTLEAPIDRAAEKRLLRKLDLRILPVLWILYLVNFIDR